MKNYYYLIPATVFFAVAGICFSYLGPYTFTLGVVSLLVGVACLIAFNEGKRM
jgi:prepilin signal peptidase PulO-like enzyme (type II secretory pathway)